MGKIVMYGADWCGDCQRSKKYFADNNIEYIYVDLEKQPDMYAEVIARNGGKKSIPVIVFSDDSHLTEPSDEQLSQKLAK